MIAVRRAELYATETGRNLAPDLRNTVTPGELARQRDRIPVRRHGATHGYDPKAD